MNMESKLLEVIDQIGEGATSLFYAESYDSFGAKTPCGSSFNHGEKYYQIIAIFSKDCFLIPLFDGVFFRVCVYVCMAINVDMTRFIVKKIFDMEHSLSLLLRNHNTID